MRVTTTVIRLLAALASLFPAVASSRADIGGALQTSRPDTCLLAAAVCLGRGSGNFYLYQLFSRRAHVVRQGEFLEYDIFVPRGQPLPRGGIDIQFQNGGSLREADNKTLKDQNGLTVHGDADFTKYVGRWLHRKIDLASLVGKTAEKWDVAFEADKFGRYVQFVDDVRITRNGATVDSIYEDGPPDSNQTDFKEGYSKFPVLMPVARADVQDGNGIDRLIDAAVARQKRRWQVEELRADADLLRDVAKDADPADKLHLLQHVQDAGRALAKIGDRDDVPEEAFQSAIHSLQGAMDHLHPLMKQYTGHLVGHAHIDFQWLWSWEETIAECNHTFGQAAKFMDEYPGYCFSQSSSVLYKTTMDHFPDVYAKIQKYVAKGQWELVGGRVCEGDEHMISPESHARHFLYGQRFFREHFHGKDATVGWEPDTFGHTWQFPQILRLAGCKYFYFCRGGKNIPLFWWVAPDGTRVLAFEEPALGAGAWYNQDVTTRLFEQMRTFLARTGSKDVLWPYGVGNHGGGPTREHIETALDWQKKGFMPNVKFSTATQFFKALSKYDLTRLPVVKTELTPADLGLPLVGDLTTHSDIKRWNRDAEAVTESAEALAAIASRVGFVYPRKDFRRNWEDITWNHHHDTLPGTSIHSSYGYSRKMYARVIGSSRSIGERAAGYIAARIRAVGPNSVMVLNPTGHERDATVQAVLPTAPSLIAVGANSVVEPVQKLPDGTGIFRARALPAYGYRVYTLREKPPAAGTADAKVNADGTVLENSRLRVEIDRETGSVTRIFDKQAAREALAPGGAANRLEIHYEKPNGASAWCIGGIDHVEALGGPITLEVIETGPVRATVRITRKFRSTAIEQTISLGRNSSAVDFSLQTRWLELGDANGLSPMLRTAFDLNVGANPAANYEIPFAAIARPANGLEVPALKWADLTSADGAFGCSLMNDCKHGYNADGNVLRLSLIRSSYAPDANPNDDDSIVTDARMPGYKPRSPYLQVARYSLLPHKGDWRAAGTVYAANAFNHPVVAAPVSHAGGTLPGERRFISVAGSGIMPTGLKQAEDDSRLVVRFYEAYGQQAHAALSASTPLLSAETVNLIEDGLHREAVVKGATVLSLRPHEIRTIRFTAAPMR